MGSRMPMMPGPPMMMPYDPHPMMVPTWPGVTWLDREEQKGPSSVFLLLVLFQQEITVLSRSVF